MAEHCKIKCKNTKKYNEVKHVLNMFAVEFYQKDEDKAIHVCGLEKEKDISKMLKKYGIKKYKIKTENHNFEDDYERE